MERDRAQCSATRRDGSRCGSVVVLPTGLCPAHDPGRAAHLRAIRQAGGKGKARTARLSRLVPGSLRSTLDMLLRGIEEVHSGDLTAAQAGGMAALASAAIRVYEVAELADRVSRLEAATEPSRRTA